MNVAQQTNDGATYYRLAPMTAAAEGRYEFAGPAYLNTLHPDIQTTTFQDWFEQNWASIP